MFARFWHRVAGEGEGTGKSAAGQREIAAGARRPPVEWESASREARRRRRGGGGGGIAVGRLEMNYAATRRERNAADDAERHEEAAADLRPYSGSV